MILAILKQTAVPGSTAFLIVCLAIWLTLRHVWPHRRGIGYGWLLIVAITYFVMSLPPVANGLADRLMSVQRTQGVSFPTLDTLVILDGDNRIGRVRQAKHEYISAQPGTVCVLGADWLVRALVRAGIPLTRITQDSTPATTYEQMAWVQRRQTTNRDNRIALIASRLQMPRVAALAKAAGLPILMIPSPIDVEPPRSGGRLFLPTYTALRVSRDALYEHAALAYYRWRGWIGPT